jgi:hypothetical protein
VFGADPPLQLDIQIRSVDEHRVLKPDAFPFGMVQERPDGDLARD